MTTILVRQSTFRIGTNVRRAQGHTDGYKPVGKDLLLFDGLYEYIIKSNPMPGGLPVWRKKLDGLRIIRGLYSHISRPFLPYKNEQGILLFPTGKWIGTYYSEELKYAPRIRHETTPGQRMD